MGGSLLLLAALYERFAEIFLRGRRPSSSAMSVVRGFAISASSIWPYGPRRGLLLYLGSGGREKEKRKGRQIVNAPSATRKSPTTEEWRRRARIDSLDSFFTRDIISPGLLLTRVRAAKERALNPRARAPPPARIRRTSVLFRLRFSGYLRGVWPSQSDRSLGVAGGSSLSSLL